MIKFALVCPKRPPVLIELTDRLSCRGAGPFGLNEESSCRGPNNQDRRGQYQSQSA